MEASVLLPTAWLAQGGPKTAKIAQILANFKMNLKRRKTSYLGVLKGAEHDGSTHLFCSNTDGPNLAHPKFRNLTKFYSFINSISSVIYAHLKHKLYEFVFFFAHALEGIAAAARMCT